MEQTTTPAADRLDSARAAYANKDWAEAERLAREAADAEPGSGAAAALLVQALLRGGNSKQAGEETKRLAVNAQDVPAEAYADLGAACLVANRLEDGRSWLTRALRHDPNDDDALQNLGACEFKAGRKERAAKILGELVRRKPDLRDARLNLIAVLMDTSQLDAAKRQCELALERRPDDMEVRFRRASVCYQLGELDQSLADCDAAIADKPDHVTAHTLRGSNLLTLGRKDEAGDAYEKACQLSPGAAAALRAIIEHRLLDDDRREALIRRADEVANNLGFRQRCELEFACGRAREQDGEMNEAHRRYAAANALAARIFPYKPEETDMLVDRLLDLDARHDAVNPSEPNGPRPIFVVGLPRSGTSLTEQILSSHSEVTGCGESLLIGQLARKHRLLADPGPEGADREAALAAFAEDYVWRMSEIAEGRPRFVDKMPANFQYIGLLARAFPNAPIIHTQRDLRDVVVSAWVRFFPAGLSWTYAWDRAAHYFTTHDRLMEAWEERRPGRVHHVRYETLVSEPRETVEALLAYCGLDWEDAVLAHQDNKRPVRTASVEQVRRPINTRSIGGWEKHKPFMRPFLDRYDADTNTMRRDGG